MAYIATLKVNVTPNNEHDEEVQYSPGSAVNRIITAKHDNSKDLKYPDSGHTGDGWSNNFADNGTSRKPVSGDSGPSTANQKTTKTNNKKVDNECTSDDHISPATRQYTPKFDQYATNAAQSKPKTDMSDTKRDENAQKTGNDSAKPDQGQMSAILPASDTDDGNPCDESPSQFPTLNMAVKNDSPQSVEKLLEQCTSIQMFSALLFSINLGRHQITKIFLDHPKYKNIRHVTELMKQGALQQALEEEPEDEDAEEADDSVLDADVTPLMLAAQRNQFEVVEALLAKGESIDEPHPTGCRCATCSQQGMDELRQAKTQLTTFRALASYSHIILANQDPIYSAFQLGQTLASMAMKEKHYKAEYLSLSEQCGELSRHILDRVRDGRELDIILNEKYGSASTYEHLARLNLAIYRGEKKFVAHPCCQKKLISLWMGHLNPKWVASPVRAIIFFLCFSVFYPFAVILYWIYPYSKVGNFLQIPIVKFVANTASYIVFVILMVGYGTEQPPQTGATLCAYIDPVGTHCRTYMDTINTTNSNFNGTAMYVRHHKIPAGTYVFVIWLMGFTWENIKKIRNEQALYFTKIFNILDFIQIVLFILSFTISFTSIGLVNSSLSYFRHWDSWIALANNDNTAEDKAYWLDADRTRWVMYDPTMIAEAVMAVASLLTVAKLTNVFTISEKIGPLLLSLAKMIEDMTAFSVVFMFIVGSFVVGFHNLYFFWYTSSQIAIGKHKEGDEPINDFHSITHIVKHCFWSIFGMSQLDDNTFATYPNGHVTTITGHVMFAFYNWMMVIILINMLIAMMSRSYEIIAETEDSEWKFARTKLFMEYIREGSTLATPFNLVPTWKGVYTLHHNFSDNWCYHMASRLHIYASRVHSEPDTDKDAESQESKSNGTVQATSKSSFPEICSIGRKIDLSAHVADNTNETSKGRSSRKQPALEYLEVINAVKKRFILNYGKGDGDEEDEMAEDITQLKDDMSTLRQELMSNLYRQDDERSKMSRRISNIEKMLIMSNQMFTQQYEQLRGDNEKKIESLKVDLQEHIDDKMKAFQLEVNNCMDDMRNDISAQLSDATTGIDNLKGNITKCSCDVVTGMQNDIATQLRDTTIGIDYLKESIASLAAGVSILCEREYLAEQRLPRRARSNTLDPITYLDLPRRPRSHTQDPISTLRRRYTPEPRASSESRQEEEEPIFPRPMGPIVQVMHKLFDK